jgi:Gnt-I system high-affinity gluconate transporter
MLGKLVAESGAAKMIASVTIGLFGVNHIQWGLMVTGFIVGIPLFFSVGFTCIMQR